MAQGFKPVKVFVPVGSLGAGVRAEEVDAALARGADVMAMDAGSTDSGAAYLATGTSKNSRGAVRADLKLLMAAQAKAKIPLIVGTAGQAGADPNVDWTVDIVREIARENGYRPKIAVLYSEQSREVIKAKNAAGKIRPLPPAGPLDDAVVDECLHIVALMGPEPYVAALEAGADIIIGGRSTDTAVLACYPLWKGAPIGPSWHAGKTGECGGQCTAFTNLGSGVMLTIDEGGFEVEPLLPKNVCTVHSVSAHMLYENSNPFRLHEPGGVLDVTDARYEQVSETRVRVTNSRWEPQPYTMKLEGASGGQYQTIMFIGITDPDVLANLDLFEQKMHHSLTRRVQRTLGDAAGKFDISLRIYGWNAVSGRAVPEGTPPPREVGVMCVITAETQELATQMAKSCNPYFFHMPLRDGVEMPSYGFPFTPADIARGQVFEFKLQHVVELDDPLELVRTAWIDLSADASKETTHA
ncbi:acyclic terpene utilization AtuA family protein [Caulobacter sp. KR2-114]|uniref:acyclic terpene utilization AtuA family protein n=1 Tax=Caulobacter sp. KR2-114 TaxID=3400912 RepID=UPI003C05619C